MAYQDPPPVTTAQIILRVLFGIILLVAVIGGASVIHIGPFAQPKAAEKAS